MIVSKMISWFFLITILSLLQYLEIRIWYLACIQNHKLYHAKFFGWKKQIECQKWKKANNQLIICEMLCDSTCTLLWNRKFNNLRNSTTQMQWLHYEIRRYFFMRFCAMHIIYVLFARVENNCSYVVQQAFQRT